jgi:hypothetical protein
VVLVEPVDLGDAPVTKAHVLSTLQPLQHLARMLQRVLLLFLDASGDEALQGLDDSLHALNVLGAQLRVDNVQVWMWGRWGETCRTGLVRWGA